MFPSLSFTGGSASNTSSLSNYADQTSKLGNTSSGYHAPIINFASGGSKLTPTNSTTDGSQSMMWIVGGLAAVVVIAGFAFMVKFKGH